MSGAHKAVLNDKRKLFIAEYLKDLNATQAAKRAGYKHPDVMGTRLIKVPQIRQAIDDFLRSRIMTSQEILKRLSEQACAEHGKYIDENGDVNLAKLRADDKMHLIKGTKRDRKNNLIVEFHDGQKALALMAKHRGLLSEKITNINVDLNSLTAEQLERVAAGEDPAHVLATSKSDDE